MGTTRREVGRGGECPKRTVLLGLYGAQRPTVSATDRLRGHRGGPLDQAVDLDVTVRVHGRGVVADGPEGTVTLTDWVG